MCKTTGIGGYLRGNSYAGRGILIGQSPDSSRAVFAYFIMGRSENSRNRIFVESADGLIIKPYDESKVKDPSLIIYTPVRVQGDCVIVTNGDQTDTVCDFLKAGKTFEEALETRCFEPDAPNYTPRISGILSHGGYKLSILKCLDANGTLCARHIFNYPGQPGLGHLIHTYANDGSPLPPFHGEPVSVSLPDGIDDLTAELWDSLDGQNKISLYVKAIDLTDGKFESRLINKNNGEHICKNSH